VAGDLGVEVRGGLVFVIVRQHADTRGMRWRCIGEQCREGDNCTCRDETETPCLHGKAANRRGRCREADFRKKFDGRKSSGFPSLQPSEMPPPACWLAINVAVLADLT
jgi:hypothetical protein